MNSLKIHCLNNEKALAVFENFKIRRTYDEKKEGSQTVTNCHRLKMVAAHGHEKRETIHG
ncbi:MAG TPA: hypothetical protein ENN79_08225 [Desulfobacteraceae bacterium]|nr:hypothetical protein [Desulfobacteraceae bacterium]